jgi:hypothetical protein
VSDLASAKARVDAARDLKELSRVEADVLARANVEHWSKAVRLEFEDHRYAKARELADRIRRAG